jgi:hypothetical protein
MRLLERRRALMSALTRFIRTISSKLPLFLTACVDNKSTIGYKLYGESVQNGTPTPNAPVEVESVGEKTVNLISPDTEHEQGFINQNGIGIKKDDNYPTINVFTISVKTNTVYSYNATVLNNVTYTLLDESKSYLGIYGGVVSKQSNVTFTTTSETAYVQICGGIGKFNNGEMFLNEGTQYLNEPYGKYKIPIRASGNVFDIDKVSFYHDYATFKKENNSLIFKTAKILSVYPTSSNMNAFNLKPNTKYICRALVTEINNGSSNESASGTMRRSLKLQTLRATYDEKAIYIVNGYSGGYKGADSEIITKFKTPADMTSYKYVVTRMADNMEVIFKDIVIMEDAGQTIDEYEPYQEPITTNIYLDEPLRKIGKYADYIDFKNQVVVRNIKKVELKNPTEIYTWSNKKGVYFLDVLDRNYSKNIYALSNRNYNSWSESQAYNNSSGMWVGVDNKSLYWTGILDVLGLTTFAEFNSWLSNNATYVLYASTKPTTTPIELPQLPTFKGTTIYSVDTSVQPSNMEVTYYSKERSVS